MTDIPSIPTCSDCGAVLPPDTLGTRCAQCLLWQEIQSKVGGPSGPGREPELGQRLGPYKIVSRLGAGGMGVVYKALEEKIDRHCAIKILSPRLTATPSAVERFFAEAKAVAKLNHPNIVHLYTFGQEGELLYFAMELVEGHSLDAFLKHGKIVPEKNAIQWMRQVATGLAYAHRQGLVHRDIKPANLLLTRDGVVKITDFGLAKNVSANTAGLTTANTLLGTPHFMSPEQAEGGALDHRSDLYSLGATFFTLLAGRPPFVADSDLGVLIRHARDPVPPIGEYNPQVSPGLAWVLEKLMAKRPADRYQRYEDLLRDLAVLKAGATLAQGVPTATPESALPPGPTTVLQRQPPVEYPKPEQRRIPWTIALAVGGTAAALLVVLGYSWLSSSSPPPESTTTVASAPVEAPRVRSPAVVEPVRTNTPPPVTTAPSHGPVALPDLASPTRSSAGAMSTTAPVITPTVAPPVESMMPELRRPPRPPIGTAEPGMAVATPVAAPADPAPPAPPTATAVTEAPRPVGPGTIGDGQLRARTTVDLANACNADVIHTGARMAADVFEPQGRRCWTTQSYLARQGRAGGNAGIPDNGVVSAPALRTAFQFRMPPEKNAILLTPANGRQPKAVEVTLPAAQQRRYQRLAVAHGACWGNGLISVTIRYTTGPEQTQELHVLDWNHATRPAGAMPDMVMLVNTGANLDHPAELWGESIPLDAQRVPQSFTFKLMRQTPSRNLDPQQAALNFTAGIFALSLIP